ncbi:MAG: YfiM family protein [Bacteroidales bacterium]|nr:YfiM family protein [Bacteroidales bacterium]
MRLRQIKYQLITLLLVLAFVPLRAQQTIDSLARRNAMIVAGSEAVVYAGTMFALHQLWFKDCPWVGIHTINDNGDWLQMDKLGHATTAYHTSLLGDESMRLAGLDSKQSALYGSAFSLLFMTSIEIMDAGHEDWGFSWGDMAADASGIALYTAQQLLWDEQRISLKYAFHPTEYAQYNPEELGHNLISQALKDYNGITIWAAFNVKELFMGSENSFPEWLTVDFGYGAKGMVAPQPTSDFDRVRQFYLAPGVDLAKLPVENRYLKALLRALSFIKLPTPALEYNASDKFVWHWLYF